MKETQKQLDYIRFIEEETGIEYKGKTKVEASKYISENKDKVPISSSINMWALISNIKLNSVGLTNVGSTANTSLWSTPERVDVIENSDSIEFIYKETSMISYTSFPSTTPQARVFKIVFSCVEGKWNKSERIYGEIIPAENERYVF